MFLSTRELLKLARMSQALRDAGVKHVEFEGFTSEELPELYFGDIEVKHPDGYTIGWFIDLAEDGEYLFCIGEEKQG